MRRLRIDKGISGRIGQCDLSRTAVIRFYTALRDDLEKRYQAYRSRRDAEDPAFFHYYLAVADETTTHNFDFLIDDSTSPDDLFIVDFWHERRP